MGFLSDLRKRATAPATAAPASPQSARFFTLPDTSYQQVVGESFYQPALAETARICAPGEEDRRAFRAYLVAEPDNPYDADAVAVHSDRGKVGHLSREDAQDYKPVMDEVARLGFAGVTCVAFLNGGEPGKPSYGVVLKLAEPRGCAAHLGIATPAQPSRTHVSASPTAAVDKNGPGMVRGKHFTQYVEEVRTLRRYGHEETAETLLLELVAATEAESATTGHGVAPWYYEQLAISYKQRKDYKAEVAILERFAAQQHAPGVEPPKLLERLDKARARVQRHPEPS